MGLSYDEAIYAVHHPTDIARTGDFGTGKQNSGVNAVLIRNGERQAKTES
jgi:hypothetical protein